MKTFNRGDVVRITKGQHMNLTGVVVRTHGDMTSVVKKGADFGIWYFTEELKRIGRVNQKQVSTCSN